jgi:hypothetical protein
MDGSFHPCVFPNVSFFLLESVSTRLQSVKNPFSHGVSIRFRVRTKPNKSCRNKRQRAMPAFTTNALGIISYPRTGKRGVPQQFPRRLYEMLQSESELLKSSSDYEDIIAWSDSGKAFRILNVSAFSSNILPKYFRTSKFSSFQRNLNLVSISYPGPISCHCHSLTQFLV